MKKTPQIRARLVTALVIAMFAVAGIASPGAAAGWIEAEGTFKITYNPTKLRFAQVKRICVIDGTFEMELKGTVDGLATGRGFVLSFTPCKLLANSSDVLAGPHFINVHGTFSGTVEGQFVEAGWFYGGSSTWEDDDVTGSTRLVDHPGNLNTRAAIPPTGSRGTYEGVLEI